MKNNTLLPGLILLLVVVATGVGIFYQTQGVRIEYVTVRGERAIFQGSGLYRYDPVALALEAVIWDVINLVIGLPLFAAAIYLCGRNSLRGRLMLAGFLSYLFYVYLMYATMMAFNRLFLVYVAIFALSLVAFVLNLRYIDVPRLPAQISNRFPRRLFASYTIILGVVLILLWLGRIIPIMAADRFPSELAGLTTLEPQALDLGLIVPLALAAGILLWRRSPWGYLLSAVGITHGVMMFLTIPMWIVVPLIQDRKVNLIEASPMMIVCLVGLFLAGWFYLSVQDERVS